MSQPNPLPGTRPQTPLKMVLTLTPVSDGFRPFFYHREAIKIIDFTEFPVGAGTAPVHTTALQSYAVSTGTDITSKQSSSASAGVAFSAATLATGATLTRPANEMLGINITGSSGTQATSCTFTLTYVVLDA